MKNKLRTALSATGSPASVSSRCWGTILVRVTGWQRTRSAGKLIGGVKGRWKLTETIPETIAWLNVLATDNLEDWIDC